LELFELQSLCADKFAQQLDSGVCGFTIQDVQQWSRLKCLDMLDELEWPGYKPGDPTYEYIKKSKHAQCRLKLSINEGELKRTTDAADRLLNAITEKGRRRQAQKEKLCDKTARKCGMNRKGKSIKVIPAKSSFKMEIAK